MSHSSHGEDPTVEDTSPQDIQLCSFTVWLTCNSPLCVFFFSRFKWVNPLTTQSHVPPQFDKMIHFTWRQQRCLRVVYLHILFEFKISHTIRNHKDTCKHTPNQRCTNIFFQTQTHTLSHLTEILRGFFFLLFFDKWFLPVSVGLWIGIISKITLGREPQSWIWESFDCWSRKKNVSQQWEKNASCIKNIFFSLSLYGGILKKLWNFQCIPALAFLVFPFFPVCLCACTGCGVFLFATWTTAHLHTIIQSAPVVIPLSPRSNSSEVCKSFFYC